MPCKGSLQDKEFAKFRPSPADDNCAVAVVPHPDPAYPQSVYVLGVTSATIQNISLGTDVEYELDVGTLTKHLTLRARGLSKVQISFTAGQTDTNFMTLFPGETLEKALGPGFQKIFLRLKNHSDTIEVTQWS